MFRKIIIPCVTGIALAALALPAGAIAVNDPQLTDNGALVPVGAEGNGTNSGEFQFVQTNGSAALTCTKVVFFFRWTANSASSVEGAITGARISGTGAINLDNNLNECTGAFGSSYVTLANAPWALRSTPSMADDEFALSGSGGTKIRFILGSTMAGACEYEATSSAVGADFTTAATTLLTVRNTQVGSGSVLIKGGFFCPSSVQLKWQFFLESSTGKELGIS
jgi:hypothetical protein